MLNDYIELYDKDGNEIKLEKVKVMPIDDKSHISHAGKPKKKVTLNFKNGASVVLTEKHNTPELWQTVDSVLIEQWLTKDEVAKLYPELIK